MVKTASPRPAGSAGQDLPELLGRIRRDFPDLELVEGTRFAWHAGKKRVSFKSTGDARQAWSLLHEVGHALLGHAGYRYDIELLQLEAAAWHRAHALAKEYGVIISEDHVQDCLDTYRDWLHLRATCPTCFARSLQVSERRYRCFNCQTEWTVTRSRLCRPYRLQAV